MEYCHVELVEKNKSCDLFDMIFSENNDDFQFKLYKYCCSIKDTSERIDFATTLINAKKNSYIPLDEFIAYLLT